MMAKEYISRETAIEKITALINKSGKYTDYECGADDACFIVEHVIPAADVVEVVRCRDCAHLRMTGLETWCFFHPQGSLGPDDFCSAGERRDI